MSRRRNRNQRKPKVEVSPNVVVGVDRKKIPDHADFNDQPSPEDSRAEEEARRIANGRDLHRSEQFKDLLNGIAMLMLGVAALGIALSFIFWFYHLLTPATWDFLADTQLRKIETVVFSGMLVGVAQTYIRRHL